MRSTGSGRLALVRNVLMALVRSLVELSDGQMMTPITSKRRRQEKYCEFRSKTEQWFDACGSDRLDGVFDIP